MAELTHAQLVDFCNATLRPLAARLHTITTRLPLTERDDRAHGRADHRGRHDLNESDGAYGDLCDPVQKRG